MAFNWIPVASTLHDPAALGAALAGYAELLASAGGSPAAAEASGAAGAQVLWVQTGGVEKRVLELWRGGGRRVALLVAHPLHNSLPAALESLARIRGEGGAGRVFFLKSPDDRAGVGGLVHAVAAAEADARLSADVFGRVGESSDWLVASSTAPEVIERCIGCRVVPVPMDSLRGAFDAEPAVGSDAPEWRYWREATATGGVSAEVFAESVRVARAMRRVAHDHGLTALTVRCFDLLTSHRATGCLALAMLSDDGITAACEGDMTAMVGLRWMWHLTGRVAWMANPSFLDEDTGEVRLAHCTVPFTAVARHAFKTHFESGIGLGIDGEFEPGPVTVLRLGENLDCYRAAEGELLAPAHDPGLCRTQVRLRLAPGDVAEWLAAPLGNHVVLARGHVKGLFAQAFEWMEAVQGER